MKNLCSYLAPVLGLTVLILCDAVFFIVYLHPEETVKIRGLVFLSIYNIIMLLAIFSLLMTWCGNPGYIPKGYCYDSSKLSLLTHALYKNVVQH